jgi:aspartate/glutamate racemase
MTHRFSIHCEQFIKSIQHTQNKLCQSNKNNQGPSMNIENVVKEHHEAPTRTICIAGTTFHTNLHSVDPSEYAKHAFQFSIDNIIKPATDQVILLNVRPFVSAQMYHRSTLIPSRYTCSITDIASEFVRPDDANKKASHDLIRSHVSPSLT